MKFYKLFSYICFALLLSLTVIPAVFADDLPRVVDDADLLTSDEEYSLSLMIADIQKNFNYDVVILTTNSCGGKDVVSFADDYYDYNGYGFGVNYDGMLFLIDMESREFYTSTCGFGNNAFSDDELDSIGNAMISYLSNAQYYKAFEIYLNEVYAELDYEINWGGNTYADNDFDPYDDYNYDENDYYSDSERIGRDPSTYWIILVVSFIIGLIAVSIMKSGMRTAVKNYGAQNYVPSNGVNFTNTRDIFLYSRTTKVRRDTNNSTGGRSGGSTHSSSSGRSHGGRGGKF